MTFSCFLSLQKASREKQSIDIRHQVATRQERLKLPKSHRNRLTLTKAYPLRGPRTRRGRPFAGRSKPFWVRFHFQLDPFELILTIMLIKSISCSLMFFFFFCTARKLLELLRRLAAR